MSRILPYDPGSLPTLPAPTTGEVITVELQGLPPKKNFHVSIRNRMHPLYSSFMALKHAATRVIAGRAWVFGKVDLELTLFTPVRFDRWTVLLFQGGIMDTLGGSSGRTFTFLPIVYQDDCQISDLKSEWVQSEDVRYVVKLTII